MDNRSDPGGPDERLDEFAEVPSPQPVTVPVQEHHNDDQSATPSDQRVFDQTDQPPSAPATPAPATTTPSS
jgi:hypothetical protein